MHNGQFLIASKVRLHLNYGKIKSLYIAQYPIVKAANISSHVILAGKPVQCNTILISLGMKLSATLNLMRADYPNRNIHHCL